MTDPAAQHAHPAAPAVIGGKDAAATKSAAAAARTELARQELAIEEEQEQLRADLEAQRRALEADFAARRAELDKQLAPLKKMVKQLQEVMWSVDLYLGRDEQLHLIRDGRPADVDTPITIRQRVLVMAEESLVLLGLKQRGMDAGDIDDFVTWLTAAPENLDRVLPEQRGVVVLIPTRVRSESGNIFEDIARDAANKTSWWLLRNGERLYLLTADIAVGERLIPRRREFVEVFDRKLFGFDRIGGTPIVPGSDEWLKLEETSDARRRHYMRIMMVLQGIIDRTPVWQPLPPARVNLLTVEAQELGKVVLIADDEDSIQLGDGREPFAQWQRRLNALMRPGIRIVGDWHTGAFADEARDWNGKRIYNDHPRLHPGSVGNYPEAGVPHLIEDRRDGGFVIRYARTDQVWRADVPVPDKPGYVYRGLHPVTPTRRASCVVKVDDKWVLPFDLATVAELRSYLTSREDRSKHFLTMVPALRSAIAAKEAEAATEAPFRELLTAQLVAAGADPDTVGETLDELVHWWKLAHSWTRPLNGSPEHEGKAVRQILAEYASRQSSESADVTDRIVTAGRKVPGVICVARNRRGRWHAYAPSTPAHDQGVFLDITEIRSDGTLGPVKTWQSIPQRSASLLRPAWHTEEWDDWKLSANPRHYLTGPERADLIERALADDTTGGLALLMTEYHDPKRPGTSRILRLYRWVHGQPEDAEPARNYRDLFDTKAGYVAVDRWTVVKDGDGTRIEPESDRWSHHQYAATHGDESLPPLKNVNIPWWPDTAARYEPRPRLAWIDRAAMWRVDGWMQRSAAQVAAERAESERREAEAMRYVPQLEEQITAAVIAPARARFDEDFPDAEDLWPAHLKSLKLKTSPIHRYDLVALIVAAIAGGHDIVGCSLDELNERTAGNLDTLGFGHVRVAAPDPDPEGTGEGGGDDEH